MLLAYISYTVYILRFLVQHLFRKKKKNSSFLVSANAESNRIYNSIYTENNIERHSHGQQIGIAQAGPFWWPITSSTVRSSIRRRRHHPLALLIWSHVTRSNHHSTALEIIVMAGFDISTSFPTLTADRSISKILPGCHIIDSPKPEK